QRGQKRRQTIGNGKGKGKGNGKHFAPFPFPFPFPFPIVCLLCVLCVSVVHLSSGSLPTVVPYGILADRSLPRSIDTIIHPSLDRSSCKRSSRMLERQTSSTIAVPFVD